MSFIDAILVFVFFKNFHSHFTLPSSSSILVCQNGTLDPDIDERRFAQASETRRLTVLVPMNIKFMEACMDFQS